MTLLDAYAVVAFLRAEPAAEQVAQLLSGGDCVTTATGVAEIVDRIVRLDGADEDDVVADLAELGLFDAVPVDTSLAVDAGLLRARHYHRTRRAVSLADCVLVVAARRRDEPLATSDPHLLDLCRDEGVTTAVLPGSDGSVWEPS